MTTIPKDHGPDARLNPALKPAIESTTQPGPGAAISGPDLESRVGVRRVALVARLRELRADMHVDAMAAGDTINEKLSELSQIIKTGLTDGWASIGDSVRRKLERWLADSGRQLAAQGVSVKTGQS